MLAGHSNLRNNAKHGEKSQENVLQQMQTTYPGLWNADSLKQGVRFGLAYGSFLADEACV